jgi:hypothetical protein
MSRRVDTWETVAAIAMFAGKPRTVRGVRYQLSAYRIAAGVDRLARLARALKRHDEDRCNGTIGSSEWILDYAKSDRIVARLEERVQAVAKELGVVVQHQRDPRGPTLKLWADKVDGRLLGCL